MTRGPKLTAAQRTAITAALASGAKPSEIASEMGVSQAAISYYARRLRPSDAAAATLAKMSEDELATSARTDREWLEWFRANAHVPTSERVRAAIALEKSAANTDTGAFVPPESSEQWAECLAELVMCQPPNVRKRVLGLLGVAELSS